MMGSGSVFTVGKRRRVYGTGKFVKLVLRARKVDVRLSKKGNSNSHGARPIHIIISMIKWILTSRSSIKSSLSGSECEQACRQPEPMRLPRNPKSATQNPEPSTPNPAPSIRNPKPDTR